MTSHQGAATNFRLLIADDDRAARETLRDVLEPVGYETVLARDGEEAVALAQREGTIHLALMDMYMPGLTGLEALEMLRQFYHALPAILLSADHDDELMRQALRARAFSVVAKPINKNVLIYVVSRAISKFYAPTSGELPA
jgi:CheY-like chemotaxis protein